MRGFDRNDFDYKLINKEFSKSSAEVESFHPIKILRLIVVFTKAIYQIITYKPDMMVYFFSAKKMGVVPDMLILYFSRLLGVHNILYIHGVGHKKIYKNKIFKFLYDRVLRGKCTLIILSETLRPDVNFISEDVYVLSNTIDIEQDGRLSTKTKKCLNNRPLVILYLSNLIREKGLLLLLKAFKKIDAKRDDVKLVVGGGFSDDDFKNEVYEYINNNDLAESVIMKGPVYGDEKDGLFQTSDIFAFPSYYSVEAFPLVLLEAISYGLPVVGSDVGAISDIIEDSRTGFLVNPNDIEALADKLSILLNSKEIRESFGLRAKNKFVSSYSFEVYTEQQRNIFLEIYDGLRG